MEVVILDIVVEGSPSEIGALLRSYRGDFPEQPVVTPVTMVGVTRPVKDDANIVPFSKHRRHKVWTPREDKYLLAQRAGGRKHRLIAKDLGRTKGSVAARLHSIEHQGSRKPLQESRQNQRWTLEEDAFLKRSVNDGASFGSLRKHLRRTSKAIRLHAQQKGWLASDGSGRTKGPF